MTPAGEQSLDGESGPTASLAVGLNAVIAAVTDDEPRVLVIREPRENAAAPPIDALPSGPFLPGQHRTLELGLRGWVEAQTRLSLGYVEQLYTFGDRGRDPREIAGGPRLISISYLALVREAGTVVAGRAVWRNWYRYFPWEDWRAGKPAILDRHIAPRLEDWIKAAGARPLSAQRRQRVAATFGWGSSAWNDELVLERYELLYEAGLVSEAAHEQSGRTDVATATQKAADDLASPMALDHRRILATGMGRLRAKIKYRPVIFELMPPTFTLLQLQRAVEALAGVRLHKQNFRRLVESGGLVESTGQVESRTGGRPAAQFRFRRRVLLERQDPGVRLPATSPNSG